MRKQDGIISFNGWQEENYILQKKFIGIFIEKCPVNPNVCEVFSTNFGAMSKIGEIPLIYLYDNGKKLKEGLNKHIPKYANEKLKPKIAISTRLNKAFYCK